MDIATLTDGVTYSGAGGLLASVFDVEGLAAGAIGAASLAAAQLLSARTGEAIRTVTIDRRAQQPPS